MATSYSTLPSSTYAGHGSQENPYGSTNYGTYDSGIGSLTSHPYQQQPNTYETNPIDSQHNDGYSTQQPQYAPTNRYAEQLTYDQQQPVNGYSNAQTLRTNDRPIGTNEGYATKSTTQPAHKKNTDYQHTASKGYQQPSYGSTTPHRVDNQHHQSQSNLAQPEYQIPNHPPRQQQQPHKSQPPPQSNLTRSERQISKKRLTSPTRHRSPSNDKNNYAYETVSKLINPSLELKPNKSSQMRAAAIKRKGEAREQKRKDAFFPSSENKAIKSKSQQQSPQTDADRSGSEKSKRNTTQAHSISRSKMNRQTDDEQSDSGRNKRNKKQSHALPKSKKNRQTDDEQSDGEKFKHNKKQSHSVPKSQKHRQTDGEQSDIEKTKRNKKQSQVVPKQHKSRRDDYQTEDNNSSGDDDHKRHRSKSQKRTTFSDSHAENHSHLPPLRRNRMPPYYGSALGYQHPLPPGHPLRGRYPYHADYPALGPYPYPGQYDHRHLYEDAYDVPPYLASYHDPYDGFFDYEKRKANMKAYKNTHNHHTDHEDHHGSIPGHENGREDGVKSQQSRKSRSRNINNKSNNSGRKSRHEYDEHGHPLRPHDFYPSPYYDRRDMLEMWRQERNDYLKKTFKPTIHDVLYSQQWMKADSYLENQRRRAVRDAQGYYFPYKKYTLKDYKDLQKVNTQNPFADVNEATIDRKERARKRQEYGAQIERQLADNSGVRQAPPHELSPRKPWHLKNDEPQDSEKTSKRERALEYAKVQVKYRPLNYNKDDPDDGLGPSEQYADNNIRHTNDDRDGSINEQTIQTNQSYDGYD